MILNEKIKLDYLYSKRHLNKLPNFFSKEEIRLLLDNTENNKHKAILETIYSCGLRLSELLNLKIKDIRSSDKIIRINQSKGNKDRIVSLPNKLLDILREYYLFINLGTIFLKEKVEIDIMKEVFSLFKKIIING
ncbi:tyrosine-type recombinase/integrase [Sphingobacterium paludis]|nr:tyrosine-type recombinase/integrase [Sphingobacterium paludis]